VDCAGVGREGVYRGEGGERGKEKSYHVSEVGGKETWENGERGTERNIVEEEKAV